MPIVTFSLQRQLREIEGRLDQGCGPRWEQQLHGCEDLAGVARLLLMVQRRTELRSADSAGIEELGQLSVTEIDERAVEMVRSP